MPPLPQLPYSYHSKSSSFITLDLYDIARRTKERELQRQETFQFCRTLNVAIVEAQDAIWNASSETAATATQKQQQQEEQMKRKMAALETLIQSSAMTDKATTTRTSEDEAAIAVADTDDLRQRREANLSLYMENYVRVRAFQHFLDTACLVPPSALLVSQDSTTTMTTAMVTDEEYLAGACMGLAQDLQRYGLGRATVRDISSVQAAANLVSHILEYLLQFDFRNGPLRRKYDGTKWSLRALETLLYELAITDNDDIENDSSSTRNNTPKTTTTNQQPPTNGKEEQSSLLLLPNEELQQIQQRMEHRDQLREQLIKLCRDGQKAAKQAIFALHRRDFDKANTLLETCEACIQNDLMPIIQQEPNLRAGSFANVVEEYVEAKLFATWLRSNNNGKPTGEILSETALILAVEPDEYIGGLCDLTGEVGRYAVQRGTVRDVDSVRLCLHTNQVIYSALQRMEYLPMGIGKKMDQTVRSSVEKIQRMLYEMSLSEAAGGRPVVAASNVELEEQPESKP